ncbi:conserved unknown protein [Ectocarpus siliculosus]|uniref:Small ribosomal subunit protein uS17 n=1 Tax=Ectocarpus siliculosus TaxID=2880 RepID=D7FQB6_ECTSI|nr:conserved unknown protein [Ectocarpus siliculosus]|eukprot:CBJ48448.1 conserved unknown protein [Ectocarpus siliculosus]
MLLLDGRDPWCVGSLALTGHRFLVPPDYREAEQHEKAYQKQDAIFVGAKRVLGKKVAKSKGMRFVKNVGLGFKTPKTAREGTYVDKKCPFTGDVSIRGRILKGLVISAGKMTNTIVIRRDYLHFVSKYRRFEKRHKNMTVHCAPCWQNVKEGDIVTIGQCRPLSKTVRFNVLEHEPCINTAVSVRKQFRMF